MKFRFEAKIYKVGINPCVDVPLRITTRMISKNGYIPVKGKIQSYTFTQTLVPVKNSEYRLYVNGPMMKGANVQVGDIAKFSIDQDFASRKKTWTMPKPLEQKLLKDDLLSAFSALTPSRQKDILKYLNNLKTEEALTRNIEKVIGQLQKRRNR